MTVKVNDEDVASKKFKPKIYNLHNLNYYPLTFYKNERKKFGLEFNCQQLEVSKDKNFVYIIDVFTNKILKIKQTANLTNQTSKDLLHRQLFRDDV